MSGSVDASCSITAIDNSINIAAGGGFKFVDLEAGGDYTQAPVGATENFDTTNLGDIADFRRTQVGAPLLQWWRATSTTTWDIYNTAPNPPTSSSTVAATATIDTGTGVISVDGSTTTFSPASPPGTLIGYNAAPADVILADGTTIANAVAIITIGGANGNIEDFRWTKFLLNEGVVKNDILTISQGQNKTCTLRVGAVDAISNLIYDVTTDTVKRQVAGGMDEPLGRHDRASFIPSVGFKSTTGLNAVGPGPATPLTTIGTTQVNNGREDTTFLVNVEEFMLKSICKEGGIQKAIASIPYGLTQPEFENGDPVKVDGEFYYEPYNTLYHDLSNPSIENHNQLRVRLTDSVGNPIRQMKHPTTLTLDLRPRAK